jgi:phosphoribosylamine--glycine ligase
MGSFSPVSDLPLGLLERTLQDHQPTLERCGRTTIVHRFPLCGLVLTDDGPKVLEFNVRLGDPETQAILPRMATDLLELLEGETPEWHDLATVDVVLAAKGYPTAPEKGDEIRGLDGGLGDDVIIFQAGTVAEGKKLFVNGGRVLNVVGTGATIDDAREVAYAAAQTITWPGVQYRRDIAL